MTRIYTLRQKLNLTQSEMARRLGLSQSRISHLEAGAKESGAVSLLLDQIEASLPVGFATTGEGGSPPSSAVGA